MNRYGRKVVVGLMAGGILLAGAGQGDLTGKDGMTGQNGQTSRIWLTRSGLGLEAEAADISSEEGNPDGDTAVAEEGEGDLSQVSSSDGDLSAGKLFEDQNTNIQSRDGIETDEGKTDKKKGKKEASKKMIAGFSQTGMIQSVSYDWGQKPSLDRLRAQFPAQVKVFFVGETKATSLPVTWEAYQEDYARSQSTYYIFTPHFDSKYLVRGMSVTDDAPYIEVRQNPGVAVEMIASAPPTVNEKKIFEYCTEDLGLSKAAACGILANMYCESGFRTNALGDGNTSVGICQWHNGRWTSLRAYTEDWQTLEGQLDYMAWELGHGYTVTDRYLKEVSNDAQGAYDAAYFWCMHYEMPDSAHTRGITRGYLARNIYWPRYGEDEEEDEKDSGKCNRSFAGTYRFEGEGHLNIRADHSEDSDLVGQIPEGRKVQVTRANGEWAHVIYRGQKGLCKMEYLTALQLDQDETETETETDQAERDRTVEGKADQDKAAGLK